mgnify:CR=1 FL=1
MAKKMTTLAITQDENFCEVVFEDYLTILVEIGPRFRAVEHNRRADNSYAVVTGPLAIGLEPLAAQAIVAWAKEYKILLKRIRFEGDVSDTLLSEINRLRSPLARAAAWASDHAAAGLEAARHGGSHAIAAAQAVIRHRKKEGNAI